MVDSGNLAANLLVLGSGYTELRASAILPAARLFGGLRDTLRVLLDVARGAAGSTGRLGDVLRKIERNRRS